MFKATYRLHAPSYRLAEGITNIVRGNNTWENRIGPLSIGAYVFLGTMLLSFVQWYMIAILFGWLVKKVRKSGSIVNGVGDGPPKNTE